MPGTQPRAYQFGPYRLEVQERLLLRGSQVIRLTPKAFDTLALLVRSSGHLLSKDELIQELWPDAHVEENNLAQYISLLRRTLEDGMEGSAYIETVPRVGYRFVAAVRELNGAGENGAHENGTGDPEVFGAEADLPGGKLPVARTVLARGFPRFAWNDACAFCSTGWSWLRRQRTALVLTAAVLALAGYVAFGPLRSLLNPPPLVRTIAVLPFQASSHGADAPAVGLTVTSDLIERLHPSPSGPALPLSGSSRFLAASIEPALAGRALGADVVLSGQIEARDAATNSVSAKLVRVADGRELWSDSFAIPTAQLSEAEERIAASAARALNWTLAESASANNQDRSGKAFEAREAYTMGRFLWNTRSAEGVFRSVALLNRAVTLAPQDARYHAALADALAFDLGSWPKAEDEARTALKLDRDLGEAHAALGFLRLFWQRDRPAAETEFQQAIKLSPAYATAHQWYALALASRGEFGGAQAEIQEARKLDPYSLPILVDECQILYLTRQFDRAEAACQEASRVDPKFRSAHVTLLKIYEQTGKGTQALAEYFRIGDISGDLDASVVPEEALRRAFAEGGLPGFWRAEALAVERSLPSKSATHALRLAELHAHLNDKQAALAWLQRLAASDDLDSLYVWFDPVFDSLHVNGQMDAIAGRIFTPRHATPTAQAP
jgi:DNA-binding winged helix-turn-helix (wHTH) protein/tetratricopeptide (TPR) repeat protein